ncbi:MAG UNVERIFIED_CONTAM: M28 family peptidase [Anaerolineae bacterium]|jgi:Zn-dependent M28 family amino/carboxypeptidase
MIVFFAAEEIGRKGSIAFVNDYVKAQNIDLRLYINVDAIGSQSYANGAVNDYQMRVFSAGPNATSPRAFMPVT